MRNIVLASIGVVAAGCSFESTGFDHESVLFVEARGVALNHDGEQGIAGMFDATCLFTTGDGALGEDYDLPSDDEEVEDSTRQNGRDVVVVSSPEGLHFMSPFAGWQEEIDRFSLEGVRAARLTATDTVALVGDANSCELVWVGTESAVSVDPSVCASGDLAVDRASGTAFVSSSDAVYAVDPSGAVEIASAAEHVAWDSAAQRLYLADADIIRAVDATGEELWSGATLGDITAITAMGTRGELAMMSRGLGGGELAILDGDDGVARLAMRTPSAAQELNSSGNGEMLAVGLPFEIHFFGVKGAE